MPWRPSVPIAALALAEAIFRGGDRGQESDESLSDLAPDIVRYRSKRLESNGVSGTLGAFIISGNTKYKDYQFAKCLAHQHNYQHWLTPKNDERPIPSV